MNMKDSIYHINLCLSGQQTILMMNSTVKKTLKICSSILMGRTVW